MSALGTYLSLTPGVAVFAVIVCFAAGAVRGFSGFGLSALAMAALAPFVTPIELVAVFWWLESSASVLLMKGGWADADRATAITLFLAAAVGLPMGLLLSGAITPESAKIVALSLLITLALAQLARLRLPGLATRAGTAGTGLFAGMVTGLSGAGGMVIALYVLARDLPARTMRGTLNIFLLGATTIGLFSHLAVGTMTSQAVTRGLILMVPTLAGVLVGRAFFTPRWEGYYKPFCLTLLIGLAGFGLIHVILGETS